MDTIFGSDGREEARTEAEAPGPRGKSRPQAAEFGEKQAPRKSATAIRERDDRDTASGAESAGTTWPLHIHGHVRGAPVRKDRRACRSGGGHSDALGRLGHDVTLVLPRYRGVDVSGASPQSAIDPLGSARQPVTFHRREERTGVTAVFVDVPELFDREGLYNVNGVDYADNAWRFAVFSRAALEYARLRGRASVSDPRARLADRPRAGVSRRCMLSPDPIVGGVPVVFTIHNLAFQGVVPASILPGSGFGWDVMRPAGARVLGQRQLPKGGIDFSERITTVSPTYAREILTPELGFGLRRHPAPASR